MNETQLQPIKPELFAGLDISQATKRDYEYRLPLFVDFTKQHGFNENALIEFKSYLLGRGDLSASTKSKYLTAAKVACREAYRLGLIPRDITANLRGFKVGSGHKVVGLNQEEVQKMADFLKDLPTTELTARLRAIFALLVFQGLRQVEITRLDVEDIHFTTGMLAVRGKGMHDKQLIHLHPQTVQALRDHIKQGKMSSGPLFRSHSNKQGRLTTMSIQRFFRGYTNHNKTVLGLFELCGVSSGGVHRLRHHYVTRLLGGLSVRDVAKFSRHAQINTVSVYDDERDVTAKAQKAFSMFNGLSVI